MMQPIDPEGQYFDLKNLSSWKEFRNEVSALIEGRDERLQRQIEIARSVEAIREESGETDKEWESEFYDNEPGTHLLFRGQRSARWDLKTSLERDCPTRKFALSDVFDHNQRIWNQMALGDRLDDVHVSEFPKQSADISVWCATKSWTIPHFEAMTTLRHMGVPSPLLDWTYSPFVAAYFAFCDAVESDSDPIAVFFFQEATGSTQCYNYHGTGLKSLEPFGQSHERHTRQQGAYTFCVQGDAARENSVTICSHKDYFLNVKKSGHSCGHLGKFTIPVSEKRSAMRDLERMNITEASLFETQDALARTLFRRTIQRLEDY